MKSIAYAGKTT